MPFDKNIAKKIISGIFKVKDNQINMEGFALKVIDEKNETEIYFIAEHNWVGNKYDLWSHNVLYAKEYMVYISDTPLNKNEILNLIDEYHTSLRLLEHKNAQELDLTRFYLKF